VPSSGNCSTVDRYMRFGQHALMPVNPETTVRKSVAIPKALWERIRSWRFQNEMNTESEALCRLIEMGLDAAGAKPKGGKR
jgi:hypothetical protein